MLRYALLLPLAGLLTNPAAQDSQRAANTAQGCCAKSAPAAQLVSEKPSLVEIAQSTGQHDTLVQAVVAAGLADLLSGQRNLTVFAPTDEAFAKLPEGTLEHLLLPENKAQLKAILAYHVVPGKVAAEQAVRLSSAETLNGQILTLDVTEGTLSLDGAQVIAADVMGRNGIVHVIDRVMLPNDKDIIDTALEAGSFGTLATALTTAGLVESLRGEGPFTVFAPTDAAFAKLGDAVPALLEERKRDELTKILTTHVVSGRTLANQAVAAGSLASLAGTELRIKIQDGNLFVNGAKLVGTDIQTTNGVIHVIDDVLLP